MPTVIDSFVVEVGLDPKNLTKGQREAVDSFSKTKEEALKGAKDIEASSKRGKEALGAMRTTALELFAAFAGGKGVANFVGGLTSADAALGRLNRSIGVSASDINKWQGAARIFGGTAEGMATSFTTISDAFAGWKVGVVSPLIADLRAISAAGGKIIDVNKGVEQSYLDLADNLKAIHDKDQALAGFLGRRIGLDPALFDILIRGAKGAKEVLDYVMKIGVATKDDTDAFGELEKRMSQMVVKAESLGRKVLGGDDGFAENIIRLADWLNESPGDALSDAAKFWGPGGGAWNKKAKGSTSSTPSRLFSETKSSGGFTSQAEKEAFIREEARKRGIDPDVAMRVAKSEGFSDYSGDRDATGKATSFGAFQLHYPGVGRNTADGLGAAFTKKTGLDARDPATEREQIKFALDEARRGGWGPWHGWKGPAFAGIGAASGGGGSTSTSEIIINGPININAGPNADGTKIGQELRSELLKRQSFAAQSNDGQQ